MLIPPIIQTKISAPVSSARILDRSRVIAELEEIRNYRLTLLQASAGYGKSTSLTHLPGIYPAIIWYQISDEDNDIFVFLLHLFYATQLALPTLNDIPIPLLEGWDNLQDPLPMVEIIHQYLNALSNGLSESCLLVLDDIHLVLDTPEISQALDRIISLAPAKLNILLTSRIPVKLPNLSRWQAHGDVLFIDQNVLKFTSEEIAHLFEQHYKHALSADEVRQLFQLTEGWAIALQLIWQSLRSGAIRSIEDLINHGTDSLNHLFKVMTYQVMEQQPQEIQDFLLVTSTLRIMTTAACDALRDKTDSRAQLEYLRQHELFVVSVGDFGWRYHNIFHQYLQGQSTDEERQAWHQKAAVYYQENENLDTAIHHLFLAQNYDQAAKLLSNYSTRLLAMGRLDTLNAHLENLSPKILHQYPTLLSYHGDLARLHSRFQEALGWYQQAEALCRERNHVEGLGRALRGQARVYLDTVSPTRAEELLQQALRLSDGTADREAQARLYELLAENRLNAGQVEDAERLRQQAVSLRLEGPGDSQLLMRVLLRTGRFEEAQQMLEEMVEIERQEPVHTPRSHRETQLLLSLIYAMQGKAEEAYHSAIEGTKRGEELNSLFVKAVGNMRQGHALMLLSDSKQYVRTRQQFERAVEISHTLDIPRLRVEACWGLCRTYGYQGDLEQARRIAQEGIDIALPSGDEWIASLVRVTMGATLVLHEQYEEATQWLSQAVRGFRECSDPFGANAARLWLCLSWHQQGDLDRLTQILPELLKNCRQHSYDWIFTRPTLIGTPDERMSVPLLILARDQGWEGTYPLRLLNTLGLGKTTLHPGYRLRVQTLGTFQAWLGDEEIPHKGWKREKSRQLFQILLIHQGTPMDRDQLCEHLWPAADPDTSQRNFKVALSTLYSVLEPARKAGSESAFIVRKGSTYSIRPHADIEYDAGNFFELVQQAEKSTDPETAQLLLKEALNLYKGELLPDARYETWAAAEREHLSVMLLRIADQYCQLSLERQETEAVIELCQSILSYDNCWERAYRHLMLAYDQVGDHGQVARTYQRCLETLQSELDVSPAPETEALYKHLTHPN